MEARVISGLTLLRENRNGKSVFAPPTVMLRTRTEESGEEHPARDD